MGKYKTNKLFEEWGEEWLERNGAPPHVCKAFRSISKCRTPLLGGREISCGKCGYAHYVFGSCGNRNCPICPALKKELWLHKRQEEILPGVVYYHIVYTIPHEWNALFQNHPREMYNIFFQSVRESYLKMISEKYEGAYGGILAIVHTWGQNLSYHPHIHTIVPGAGLSSDQKRWIYSKTDKFLLDVKDRGGLEDDSLSRRFRKTFIKNFRIWWEEKYKYFRGKARVYNEVEKLRELIIKTSGKKWVVYGKAPTQGSDQVLKYLSEYVHRVAFSESRILEVVENAVHFGYKNYKKVDEKGIAKKESMWIEGQTFLSKFASHILPKGYQRIRYYGLLGTANRRKKHAVAKQILGGSQLVKSVVWSVGYFLKEVLGIDPDVCPRCGSRGSFVTNPIDKEGRVIYLEKSPLVRGPPIYNMNSMMPLFITPN